MAVLLILGHALYLGSQVEGRGQQWGHQHGRLAVRAAGEGAVPAILVNTATGAKWNRAELSSGGISVRSGREQQLSTVQCASGPCCLPLHRP